MQGVCPTARVPCAQRTCVFNNWQDANALSLCTEGNVIFILQVGSQTHHPPCRRHLLSAPARLLLVWNKSIVPLCADVQKCETVESCLLTGLATALDQLSLLFQLMSCQNIPTEHLLHAVHSLSAGNSVIHNTDTVSLPGLLHPREAIQEA